MKRTESTTYRRSLRFSDTLCRLVGSHVHVAAKRYLTAIDPAYTTYTALSAASKKSLHFQGGPLERGGKELEIFMTESLSEDMIKFRKWNGDFPTTLVYATGSQA